MKHIKDLGAELNEDVIPKKAKVEFNLTANLKRISKLKKTLIDTNQQLTEMADQIMMLNFNDLDKASVKTLNRMRRNINAMIKGLKERKEDTNLTGMIDNCDRIEARLGELKADFFLTRR